MGSSTRCSRRGPARSSAGESRTPAPRASIAWHHHVNTAQILSTTGGDASFAKYAALYRAAPAYKDTVIVPKRGSVSLLVPILDYTGRTVFHCHIVEHEDIGMMGVWNIGS